MVRNFSKLRKIIPIVSHQNMFEKTANYFDAKSRFSGIIRICAKTIKRGDCIELGQDKFDEALNEFLGKLKREQILSVHPVNYAHYDPATQKYLDDYGAMVIYER